MTEPYESEFTKKFINLIDSRGMDLPENWESLFFDFDTTIFWGIDTDKRRMFSINHNIDSGFNFDYVINKAGENYDYDDLSLDFEEPEKYLDFSVEIYKMWFFDKVSSSSMEEFLKKKFEDLN